MKVPVQSNWRLPVPLESLLSTKPLWMYFLHFITGDQQVHHPRVIQSLKGPICIQDFSHLQVDSGWGLIQCTGSGIVVKQACWDCGAGGRRERTEILNKVIPLPFYCRDLYSPIWVELADNSLKKHPILTSYSHVFTSALWVISLNGVPWKQTSLICKFLQ